MFGAAAGLRIEQLISFPRTINAVFEGGSPTRLGLCVVAGAALYVWSRSIGTEAEKAAVAREKAARYQYANALDRSSWTTVGATRSTRMVMIVEDAAPSPKLVVRVFKSKKIYGTHLSTFLEQHFDRHCQVNSPRCRMPG